MDNFVCAETKVSDGHYLSDLLVPCFGCLQQKLNNFASGAQDLVPYYRVIVCAAMFADSVSFTVHQ